MVEPIAAFWEQLGMGIRGGLAAKQRRQAEERQWARQLELLGLKQEFATGEREAGEAQQLRMFGVKKKAAEAPRRQMAELLAERIVGPAPEPMPEPVFDESAARKAAVEAGREAVETIEAGKVPRAWPAYTAKTFASETYEEAFAKERKKHERAMAQYKVRGLEIETHKQSLDLAKQLGGLGMSAADIQKVLGGEPADPAESLLDLKAIFKGMAPDKLKTFLQDPLTGADSIALQMLARRYSGGDTAELTRWARAFVLEE